MNSDPSVFIVDPDIVCRKAMADCLNARGLPTCGFNSAEQFLNSYDRRRPGCLLVEVQLPGMSGLQLQERLGRYNVTIPFITVASEADVTMAVRAMKAGAVDFLLKPCQELPLWEAIQTALEFDAARRAGHALRVEVRARLARLTAEEHTVMTMLLDGKPAKSIASALDVSQRTVDFRRASMMRKMLASSIVELARLVVAADPPAEVHVWTWPRQSLVSQSSHQSSHVLVGNGRPRSLKPTTAKS